MTSKKKKIVLLVSTAALVGGTAFAMTGTGNASQESDNRVSQFCLAAENFLSDSDVFIINEERNNFPNKEARIARQQELVRQTIANQERLGC
ncbi:hypothetical protein SLUN_37510 [Streptomyces lunaelactis]|uniref:Secreted protein n=1 Tax=Streptomyces lunaelactis TaxID=1535768 RepID=A0A2R4TD20_9ACTN|nr:hypothetical protein [Streptomyces lunaelactis]AVZ77029.1 hypothetical protein SLUN_37510 [Streptomyces lunaelactis]NUK85474.1 hypothetical protein [Streptomyces lunaelactis]